MSAAGFEPGSFRSQAEFGMPVWFWSELLGVGELYYELGVQVVELCVATSHLNGGLLPLQDALRRLNARGARKNNPIAEDDIVRAVRKLRVLGAGVEVVQLGRAQYITAIPGELTMDHTTLLQFAERDSNEPSSRGRITIPGVCADLGWTEERARRGVEQMLRAGVAWRDDVDNSYWFPAVFQNALS
ncbi:EAP30 [Trinorchestia longiramus]|nr:EAP30 [Trinorchestia longiramus]